MKEETVQFVASITRDVSEIRKIQSLWKDSGDPRNPLRRVLVTPLFTRPSALRLVREMKEAGVISEVWFDSGGYFVQMGRIAYDEMYLQLLNFYRVNTWADWYVLPDYVPTSTDTPSDVWHKVRRTADGGRLFFSEMPDSLKPKALLVMQGHTIEQIEHCLSQYLTTGVKRLGFGSFGTNGKASSVNSLTPSSLNLLIHLRNVLKQTAIHLHAFGVGTPPVIFLLGNVGVHSFDSVGWMKTAGFGKIYMPFVRAFNITYKDLIARGLKRDEFLNLKMVTGHDCMYCQSFEELQANRFARIMHNLTVVLDTVENIQRNQNLARSLLEQYSPFYAGMLESLEK